MITMADFLLFTKMRDDLEDAPTPYVKPEDREDGVVERFLAGLQAEREREDAVAVEPPGAMYRRAFETASSQATALRSSYVYVVAQAGEDQAMAFLGPCGRDGVLAAMAEWDASHSGDRAHGEYEWTAYECLDVYEIRHPVSAHDAINTPLLKMGVWPVGSIAPVDVLDVIDADA